MYDHLSGTFNTIYRFASEYKTISDNLSNIFSEAL